MTAMIAFIGRLGTTELIVIALIVLLLFGGRKIPELMRGLGKGVREFKDASSKLKDELKEDKSAPESEEKRDEKRTES
jgi:sec-independent protein translocase protein TatA